jgi:preprotein translocase subunit SecE
MSGLSAMKDNSIPSPFTLFLQEMTRGELYKRTQGKMTRQLTCIAIWVAAALLAYRVYNFRTAIPKIIGDWGTTTVYLGYGIPVVILLVGLWLGYRIVNYAPFADFLIAVEAEMSKVSWPTQQQMTRASAVVIVLILGLTGIVYFYDIILRYVLMMLGIVPE